MGLANLRLIDTTAADGTKTITAPYPIKGLLIGVEWVVGDLAAGVDGTLTAQNTPSGVARTLLTLTNANANAFYNVREAEHDTTGQATTSGSTCYPMICGTPQLAIAQGGNAKTGGMVLYYLPL